VDIHAFKCTEIIVPIISSFKKKLNFYKQKFIAKLQFNKQNKTKQSKHLQFFKELQSRHLFLSSHHLHFSLVPRLKRHQSIHYVSAMLLLVEFPNFDVFRETVTFISRRGIPGHHIRAAKTVLHADGLSHTEFGAFGPDNLCEV